MKLGGKFGQTVNCKRLNPAGIECLLLKLLSAARWVVARYNGELPDVTHTYVPISDHDMARLCERR